MRSHKLKVDVPEDHRVSVCLPEDFPVGPAEIVVRASETRPVDPSRRVPLLTALQELRSFRPTEEEGRILDELEGFRRESSLRLASLDGE